MKEAKEEKEEKKNNKKRPTSSKAEAKVQKKRTKQFEVPSSSADDDNDDEDDKPLQLGKKGKAPKEANLPGNNFLASLDDARRNFLAYLKDSERVNTLLDANEKLQANLTKEAEALKVERKKLAEEKAEHGTVLMVVEALRAQTLKVAALEEKVKEYQAKLMSVLPDTTDEPTGLVDDDDTAHVNIME